MSTIDNVLCVLLYRHPHAFRRRFVAEMRRACYLRHQDPKLAVYETAQLLRATKESLLFVFVGLPEDANAEANCFEVDDIMLREKRSDRQHPCPCLCLCQCKAVCAASNHLVRLALGIQCDDARLARADDADADYDSEAETADCDRDHDNEAVMSLLSHLTPENRLGVLSFNNEFKILQPLQSVKNIDGALKQI